MAESDHREPYRTHTQIHIAMPNGVDKTAATNQPGDTQHTGTHLERWTGREKQYLISLTSGGRILMIDPPMI